MVLRVSHLRDTQSFILLPTLLVERTGRLVRQQLTRLDKELNNKDRLSNCKT